MRDSNQSGRFRKNACEYTEIEDWAAIELLPAKMGLLLRAEASKLARIMGKATGIRVYRATDSQIEVAYAIVKEYYEAAAVVAREDAAKFAEEYFADGAGVWLAQGDDRVVGCIALRKLAGREGCGEIKRLYVRRESRGSGVADRLLQALEEYAKAFGYEWLYLDTAADMKAAARFYEKKGFERCERYNENPQAAIFMRKALR